MIEGHEYMKCLHLEFNEMTCPVLLFWLLVLKSDCGIEPFVLKNGSRQQHFLFNNIVFMFGD